MGLLLRAEAFKLSRLALLRAIVVLLLLAAVLRGLVWSPDPNTPWKGLWSSFPVAQATIVIAAVTVGQEFSSGTFRGLVTRGVPRWHFLASRFVVLALLAGLLLVTTEGLATWLGVRPALDLGQVLRAWLSMWPLIALVILITVLTRNGGLAFILGILQLSMEQLLAMFLAPLIAFPDVISAALRPFTHEGIAGTLYRWSLSYNSANWTYLAEYRNAPPPANLLLYGLPSSTARSVLLLAAYTIVALALSALVLYRRDVTEVLEGDGRWSRLILRRRRGVQVAATTRLPLGTGRGPLVVRLARAHLFRIGRTGTVRIVAVVALLFPLTLWLISILAQKAGGDTTMLWMHGEGNAPPLAFVLSMLVVGPLAIVLATLAVSNELALGTRRVEMVRGTGRLPVIVSQSLALVLVLGAAVAVMSAVSLLGGVHFATTWHVLPALTVILTGTLGTAVYIAVVQVAGAITRSPVGTLLCGVGFLLADWLLLLAPTITRSSGLLMDLSRYSPAACVLAAASWGRLEFIFYGWHLLHLAPAFLILVAYAVGGHLLAGFIASRRDA